MKVQHPCFLVVEDSLADQILINRALRSVCSHPIRTVNSANEAIRYLNGEGHFADRSQFPYPTTIMTDLKMQNGDGFDLLQNLKHNPLWAIIPTIVLSSSNDLDDIKGSYLLGASCYLVKPNDYFRLQQLMGKIVDFWKECEIPEVDVSGKMLGTESGGKMGERFEHAGPSPTERH
ncbi:MAG TPA: response regulator [Verrucomicrobiae bacterium]|nr:response regulator [Verrucomicrobiae bacterium]